MQIPYGDHLGQADILLIQLHAVENHRITVALGKIQMDAAESRLVRNIGIGDAGAGGGIGIVAEAHGGTLPNGDTTSHDAGFLPLEPLPYLCIQAGGCGKQQILEFKLSIAEVKVHFFQLLLGQKAQGQIGLIFQQMHTLIMMHIGKILAAAILVIPLDHVFETKEQVRNRGAFLIAVAVIGVLRTVAQCPHKPCGLDIGRAGKGRNAPIAVEGTVIQGLGMGGLCPIEQVVFLPLLHIPDHRGRPLGALGVIGHIGSGEIQTKGRQGGDQFRYGKEDYQHPGIFPAAVAEVPLLLPLLRRCIFRKLVPDRPADQGDAVGAEEDPIINKVDRDLPLLAQQGDRGGIRQPIEATQNRRRGSHRRQNLSHIEPSPQQPAPIGHAQQHKAVQEAEAVGDHIGEVETVPDIIQLPNDKAYIKKQQQCHGANFLPGLDTPGHEIQHRKQNGAHAAVQIGQALLEVWLNGTAHIAGHLAHGIQQSQNGVGGGNVQPEAGGKGIDAGLGGLQCRKGRQLQNGRHAQSQHRKQCNPAQVGKESFPALPAADLIGKKQQEHKDAHKKANIIVGKHRQKQGQGVQHTLLIPQQLHRPQHHQRQQCEGIQPHNVPLEAQRPGAQTVKPAEDRNGQVVFAVELLQQDSKEQPRQPQLHRHHQRKIGQQEPFRHQHAQKVQWRCQIVGDQPQIVHAQTHIPAVQQALPAAQGPVKGHEEGVILMIHIGIQHGILAEGLIAADQHNKQHSHAGKGKSQGQRPQLRFLQMLHLDSPDLKIAATAQIVSPNRQEIFPFL